MITIEQVEALLEEHPYKVSGRWETYDPYNEGWCAALYRVLGILEEASQDESANQETDLGGSV